MEKKIDFVTSTPKTTFEKLVGTRIEFANIYNHLMGQINETLNEVEDRNRELARAILGDKEVVYIKCDKFDVWVQDNDQEQRNATVYEVICSKNLNEYDENGNNLIHFDFVLEHTNEVCDLDEMFDYSYQIDLNSILEDAVKEFSK